MLDAVKQKYVVDSCYLNIDGLIGEVLHTWSDRGNDTYLDIELGSLEEMFMKVNEEGEWIWDDEQIKRYPALYKLLQMIYNKDLPEEFILLLWW